MKKAVLLLFSLLLAAALILFPEVTRAAAAESVTLCLTTALPALFPFLFLSRFIISTGVGSSIGKALPLGRLFGLSDAGTEALVLGLTGGYPVGARTIRTLSERGELELREAQRLLPLANACGPGFIFGAVGGAALGCPRAGLIVFVSQLAAVTVLGLLTRKNVPLRERRLQRHDTDTGSAFTQSAEESLAAFGKISAYVILFGVLLAVPKELGLFSALEGTVLHPAVLGIFELTGACGALRGFSGVPACAAAGFITCWGGLCVHLQTASVLRGSGLSLKRYLAGKAVISAASSLTAAALAALFLPTARQTAAIATSDGTLNISAVYAARFALPWLILLVFTALVCRIGSEDGKT